MLVVAAVDGLAYLANYSGRTVAVCIAALVDLEHVGSFEIVERLVETGSSDSVDNAAPCRTAARRSAAARSCPCSPGSQAGRDGPAGGNDGQAGRSAQLHMRSVPRSLEPGALAGFHRHLGSQEAGNTDSAEIAVLDSAFCGPSLVAVVVDAASAAAAFGAVALCSVDRFAGHVGDQHGDSNSAFVGPDCGTSPWAGTGWDPRARAGGGRG